ncbi:MULTISPECIES: CHRD domain-containing protein [Brevibacillus]|uniref:CHRD domain-containing protein n=1 Tax=Brevibacillus TaxID=55080 RepID=UPI000D11344C|nr:MULTISPECIES: CHRD domain-containing protein [Brevibacillus]PSJ69141.1 CHRD domain-containing protein [Brevibacillus brevis]RED27577.1 CHRD domain-containing protein [Brevibacillus brevis]TQK53777.1 CHRD domain-containing protein [Brevibacillus sp. AG162]VEF91431.1 CHRD domain [Brevibacillus brevis]GEC93152.1 CHRD domain-containing protein [Brevibacillus brevis]
MTLRFRAFLRGSEEVPPVRTNATGTTSFRLSQNKQRLDFRLVVNNLRNFTEAHIHVGARGVNGPVVVFLFGPVTRGISVNRGVVTGSITQADLVGPLQGRPLSELIRLMKNGQTYVNVHTTQNPDGEIRGQIRRALRRNKK